MYKNKKIRTYGYKVYTNFCDLNMSEHHVECESFTAISVDSLLLYQNKCYLQVYLDNCAYKIANKTMTDYLHENLFEDYILEMLYYERTDINEGIDLAKSNISKECMICYY